MELDQDPRWLRLHDTEWICRCCESTQHPLAIEQRDGITFDRLLDIYAANGHDMRAALSA
jgi:hypothetical protein